LNETQIRIPTQKDRSIKGFAFIEFKNNQDALKASQILDRMKILGCKLKARIAENN